jgi:hypothetical protein
MANILATPRWSPGREHPPLGPGAAMRLAAQALSQTVTNVQQWEFMELALDQPFDDRDFPQGYWIYNIRYNGPRKKSDQANVTIGSTLNFYVLMNGKVLPLEPVTPKQK